MNKKLNFIVALLLIILSFTPALSDTVEINNNYVVNGKPANITASCNITLIYQNGTPIIRNASMSNLGGGFFNYTLITNATGEFPYVTYCCDNTECGSQSGVIKHKQMLVTLECGDTIEKQIMMWAIFLAILLVFGIAHFIDFMAIIKTFMSLSMMAWSLYFTGCEKNIGIIFFGVSILMLGYSVIWCNIIDMLKWLHK